MYCVYAYLWMACELPQIISQLHIVVQPYKYFTKHRSGTAQCNSQARHVCQKRNMNFNYNYSARKPSCYDIIIIKAEFM